MARGNRSRLSAIRPNELELLFALRLGAGSGIRRSDAPDLDFVFRRRPRGYFLLLFGDSDPLVIPPFLAFLDVTLIRHLLPAGLAEIRAARQQ